MNSRLYNPCDSDTESVDSTVYSPLSPNGSRASTPPASPIASRTRLTLAVANVHTGRVTLKMPTFYDLVGNKWSCDTAIECADVLTNGVYPKTISLKCHDEYIATDSDEEEEVTVVKVVKTGACHDVTWDYMLTGFPRTTILSFLSNEDKHWLSCTSMKYLALQPNMHHFVTPKSNWTYRRCRIVCDNFILNSAHRMNREYDPSHFNLIIDMGRTGEIDFENHPDSELFARKFLITKDTLDARWIQSLFVSFYDQLLNDEYHIDLLGVDRDQPYHMVLHPCPKIERSIAPTSCNYTLYWFNALSRHITCKNCGHLSCCNGITNKQNDYAEFRARHVRDCPFVAMLSKLDDDELEMLSFYVKMSSFEFVDLLEPENFPWYNEFVVERILTGNNHFALLEQVVAVNHARYNVYYNEHGAREEIPTTYTPSEFAAVYDEGHLFFRTQIKNGCHLCINRFCPVYGHCHEFEHYHRCTRGKHAGIAPQFEFYQV